MKNTNESETLEAVRDSQLGELESALDTLADNIREAIEAVKAAHYKLESLELWEYFNDSSGQLQEILDLIAKDERLSYYFSYIGGIDWLIGHLRKYKAERENRE